MANIKKNLVYNFLLSISQVLIPLVSIPYLSRVLHPEGIGRVGFIDSFTWYFIAVAEFGIAIYGTRAIAGMRDNVVAKGKLVSELLGLHFITSAITLVIYSVAVFISWTKIHDTRLLMISLTFLLTNFFACEWYFRGMEQFRYITIRSLITRFGGLLAIFLLVKQPADYYLYYGIVVAAAIGNNVLNVYSLFKAVPVSFRNLSFKKHLSSTRIIYFISITYSITYLLDNVLLGIASTVAAVGFYSFSIKIVRLSTNLITDSMVVFFPRITALAQEGNEADTHRVTLRNLQVITFFAVPLSVGLFLIADQLVLVMLGPQYEPAILCLQLLAIYPCLKAYNLYLGNQVLIVHHKEAVYLKNLTVSGIAFIVVSLILSFYYAAPGACIALLVAEIITLVMHVEAVKRLLSSGIQVFDWQSLLYALLVSSLFIPLVYLLKWIEMPVFARLAATITVCFCTYLLIQWKVYKNNLVLTAKEWIQNMVTK